MIHVLLDDGSLVGVIANLETETVREAVIKVDTVFRRRIEAEPVFPFPGDGELERLMCEDLGICWDARMSGWTDVLLAYLVDCGGTLVDCLAVEATPPLVKEAAC